MSRFTFLGRLVQGDPFKPQPQSKDSRTGQPKFRKDGSPDCPYYIAIAIEKDAARRFLIDGVPDFESQRALVDNLARTAWPQFFGARPQGLAFGLHLPADCTNPKFSNKIFDGDGFDEKGRPYSNNDGWAGCWVIKLTSYFAPRVQEWRDDQVDGRGSLLPAGWFDCERTGRTIKLGDYISASGTCESNKSTDSPGMYMNLDLVAFEKEGELIVSRAAVDPTQALGTRGGGATNPPANAAAGAAHSSGTAPGGQTSSTASDPAPYSGYRETPPPPPGDAAPPPPPAAGPTMTAKANGKSLESFLAAGWTVDQLREHGYLA